MFLCCNSWRGRARFSRTTTTLLLLLHPNPALIKVNEKKSEKKKKIQLLYENFNPITRCREIYLTDELAAYAGQDAPATITSLSTLALYSLSILPIPRLTAQNQNTYLLSDLRPSLTHRDFSLSYIRFNHAAPAQLLMLSVRSRLLEARLSLGYAMLAPHK